MKFFKDTEIRMFLSAWHFLTVFAVDFHCVGGELESCSPLVCLWKPEVLYLTVSAQHVHI